MVFDDFDLQFYGKYLVFSGAGGSAGGSYSSLIERPQPLSTKFPVRLLL